MRSLEWIVEHKQTSAVAARERSLPCLSLILPVTERRLPSDNGQIISNGDHAMPHINEINCGRNHIVQLSLSPSLSFV